MILICALSLANGFENELVEKILGTSPHIQIEPGLFDKISNYNNIIKDIQSLKEVKGVFPSIRGQCLITDGESTTGTLIYGIDPVIERIKGNWDDYVIKGALPEKGLGAVVIGSELAKKMGLSIGDDVQLVTGIGSITPLKITGLFQSGLYELDVRVTYVNLYQAQSMYNFKKNEVNSISIKVYDVFNLKNLTNNLRQKYPAYSIRTWIDKNKSLLAAMALEKKVIFLVVVFIIIVAMLGISNTLVMLVIEKTSEISILRTLGASKNNISNIFLIEGIIIGLAGIIIGCLGGYLVSTLLSHYPINLPNDVYYIEKLPVKIQVMDFLYVSISTFLICLIASFIPARRSVRFEPIEILRRIT